MKWPGTLLPARFVRRDNRFRAQVTLDGELISAHVPNSGRLGELLVPGAAVWIRRHDRGAARKTASDLVLVAYSGVLVSIDSRLPNTLLAQALTSRSVPQFAGYTEIIPEVTVGQSRLDFLLSTGQGTSGSERCWVETKSVTLVEDRTALFPDAPTERGLRHLRELMDLRERFGDRVAVVFVIQRPDAVAFAPHPTAHPAFAAMLREAWQAGVEVVAQRCQVDLNEISLADRVAVHL
ncbi:MAG: DNA/RNA nuclease SfsA [Anaerolineae bacterium]|nr:DNA/RNA nuclease SfsA [Anaerolineae bacterium]